jgi:radical SAM superfamily enzyme YgiQ (UPF0313 family)
MLESNGFDILLIDAPAQRLDYESVLERAIDFAPRLIVVDTSTPSIYNDASVASRLQTATGAFTLLVGPHPSALPLETLQIDEGIDAVAIGEYEITVLELAQYLDANPAPTLEGLKKIGGLAFRHQAGIYRNASRDLSYELDRLPFVSSVYLKHLDYTNYFYAHSKQPIVVTVTARGCPHKCIYCVYPQTFSGRKVRYRSVDSVVDEVEYILDNFSGLKEIMFEDDTLTINKKRCIEFSKEILRRGLKFEWSANSRADVDLETMQILKKAGARLFCVGVESGVQSVLDNMKKNLKVERIRQFFKDARAAGILVHGCFLVGNPGETMETLGKTLAFAKELNPDTAQFFPIMVYPGTEAYEWAKESSYLVTQDFSEWVTAEGLHKTLISRPGLSAEDLNKFCDRARREFYLRPGYILSKGVQAIKDFHEMRRLIKGAYTLSKHIVRSGN